MKPMNLGEERCGAGSHLADMLSGRSKSSRPAQTRVKLGKTNRVVSRILIDNVG